MLVALGLLLLSYAVPYTVVIALTLCAIATAIFVFLTGQFQLLILVGAVLEAIIYVMAGLCVFRLRSRKPDAERSFRIKGGRVIALLTVGIFGLLAFAAALAPNTPGVSIGTPLIVTLAIFLLSTLYVSLLVPRLRRAAAARKPARRRRPAESPQAEKETPA